MRNVTITLEDEVARWARVEAARRDMSLSRMVGELLREHMREEQAYDSAMAEYLSRGPTGLKSGGDRYPRREEIHDRAGLR
jgi:hypothetical protein